MDFQEKQRIIQEFVPGKQVTLAHLIANPDPTLYKKLGAVTESTGALGVLTITPSEGVIIAADVATKAGDVQLVFVDRFSGTLVICGDITSVEAALIGVLDTLCGQMGFAQTTITRT